MTWLQFLDGNNRVVRGRSLDNWQDATSEDGVKYEFCDLDRKSLEYLADGEKLNWFDFVHSHEERRALMPFQEFIDPDYVLSVSENGYGLLALGIEYRRGRRDGAGQINMISHSPIAAQVVVKRFDQIMVVCDQSTMIRLRVGGMRVSQRNMHGQPLITLKKGERVVSVGVVTEHDDDFGE